MKEQDKKQKKSAKQIAAIVCILLLVAMYVVTFIVACLDFPGWGRLFQACIVATIGLPILLWIYIGMYGWLKQMQAIVSLDILQDKQEGKEDGQV